VTALVVRVGWVETALKRLVAKNAMQRVATPSMTTDAQARDCMTRLGQGSRQRPIGPEELRSLRHALRQLRQRATVMLKRCSGRRLGRMP
jgi:hypothetical protein